jgi:hypothetical protein
LHGAHVDALAEELLLGALGGFHDVGDLLELLALEAFNYLVLAVVLILVKVLLVLSAEAF